ncbi:hypothetical protein D1007_51917 [Hordeum vulgare]|nr:hypothetical protein D1007_51917 [Hordeum vulgare]
MTNHRREKEQHWTIGLRLPASLCSRGSLTGLCLAVAGLPKTPPVTTTAVPFFLPLRTGPLLCVQHAWEMDEDDGEKVPPGIDVMVVKKGQEPIVVGRGPLTGLFLSVSRLSEAPPVTTAVPVFLPLRTGPLRCVQRQHTGEMEEDGGEKVPPGIDFLIAKKGQEPVVVGRGPLNGLFLAVSRLPETPPVTTAVPVLVPLRTGPLRCVQHAGEMDEDGGEKVPPGIDFFRVAKKGQEPTVVGRGPLTGLFLAVSMLPGTPSVNTVLSMAPPLHRGAVRCVYYNGKMELFLVDGELAFLPTRRFVHIVVTQGNHSSRAGLGVHGCNIMAISVSPRAFYIPVHGAFGLRSINNLFPHPVSSRIEQGKIDKLRQLLHEHSCRQWFHTVFDASIVAVGTTQVWRHNSYRAYLGAPLQQNVPNTCALAATTKCIEIAHRWAYETVHGANTFPCIAAAPRKLRSICRRKEIWDPNKGAVAGCVLDKIMEEGGIRTTNAATPAPAFLPLAAWEFHSSELGGGLTQDHIADLLDTQGPFVGNIWVCPWYDLFDSDVDDDMVYISGCARDPVAQESSQKDFDKLVGFHSVVCFEYRLCGCDMHVHVLDNHSRTGPKREVGAHPRDRGGIHTRGAAHESD